ncbi:phosphoglucosamine mutase [Halorubrum californiense DSM 19288]|uniref:Phosphoglucosamine mutase n=1 Tax=Halorubrum californiense DSM 19288 TaxID=1227465 RepID=M0E1N1_9EURY|nr:MULTISPECIES: phosphoglucosamine mutase [Halorubrum]ELZ40249.1 phosphoglucosamine mutase [Halorubrum californiense DSM 19288]TKX68509.1 phosphoglucosamine mutase [Halorubrum sp. GN11GM_10-3_MGM]
MFGTSGVRGPVGETVTADLALGIGRAVATDGAASVVVGRDARDSGRMLVRALTAGLIECGADVIDVGVEATPTVARAVVREEADAGLVVTASHNPAPDNGIKLWTASGRAFDEERNDRIAEIVDAESFAFAAHDAIGGVEERDAAAGGDARTAHERALRESVPLPDDLSVVVDLGNGAGRVAADALHAAGCDVEALNGQRDGRFPGRPSEPTAANCETACEVVAATDADLGIVHDGDADRTMAIDERGRFLPGDALLALFARREAEAGDRVAVPVDTSLLVADALAEVGAEVTYTPVGDSYVAAEAAKPGVAFGGEPSGSWIWPDRTLCPDGPLAACVLTALVGAEGSLAALVDDLPEYPIRRDSVRTGDKTAIVERVGEIAAAEYDDVSTLDGVRVETDAGWFLVRASGTEPLVRITAEARDEDDAAALFGTARDLIDRAAEDGD